MLLLDVPVLAGKVEVNLADVRVEFAAKETVVKRRIEQGDDSARSLSSTWTSLNLAWHAMAELNWLDTKRSC